MDKTYFPFIDKVEYEGPGSRNPLAFKHYNPGETVMGKNMRDHLRFAVCFWHTFRGGGADVFGPGTITQPWETQTDPMAAARERINAAFEFFTKLGVNFWCFHDRDIAPEADTLAETNDRLDEIAELADALQRRTGVALLWGTTNSFSHKRFMSGASTNPSPHVFAYAAAQVKKAMETTHKLGGLGYVFWGGREGYDTLLNTDIKLELENLAALLKMAVAHKKQIGFTGQLLIEPKPKEPTKHQYDSSAAAVHGFLLKHGLEHDFKLNIEANHATLAGHDFQHELEYSAAHGILGSVDANRGDTLLGWDTDQFPTDIRETTLAMLTILKHGGLTTGGLNFDAKLRRQSTAPEDLFHAHIGAMDAFARGLKNAAAIIQDGRIHEFVNQRYREWQNPLGQSIRTGAATFDDMEKHIKANGEPGTASGRQEMLENLLNEFL